MFREVGKAIGQSAAKQVVTEFLNSPKFEATITKLVRERLRVIFLKGQAMSQEERYWDERCAECGLKGRPIGDPENPDYYACRWHHPQSPDYGKPMPAIFRASGCQGDES